MSYHWPVLDFYSSFQLITLIWFEELTKSTSFWKGILFYASLHVFQGVVMAVIIWQLDLQLLMQSVPITTDVVSSNLDQGKVYNIMW